MQREREDIQLIELFLRGLNEKEGESYEICERPDQDDRKNRRPDAIAKNRVGSWLAIEHTLLQPFEGQKADDARFNKVSGLLRSDKTLPVPGHRVAVFLPAFSVPTGVNWEHAGQKVTEWFRDVRLTLSDGESEHAIPKLGFDLHVIVHKMDITKWVPHTQGMLSVGRVLPDSRYPQKLVRKALGDKLCKLLKEPADKRILLVENQTPAWAYRQIAEAIELVEPEFPELKKIEAIWLVDTIPWKTEGYVFYNIIWPPTVWKGFLVPT
jgi:hypothetical protein